ncbi:hypothetical protein ACHAXR_004983 [Thalassiosira sp. AJA248-18]
MMASLSPPPIHCNNSTGGEVDRLRSRLASGDLLHPYLSAEYFSRGQSSSSSPSSSKPNNNASCTSTTSSSSSSPSAVRDSDIRDNFVDLAASLSICCGVTPPTVDASADSSSPSSSFLQNFTTNKHVEQEIHRRRLRLASEIGGGNAAKKIDDDDDGDDDGNNNDTYYYERRHIVLILCDGMGNSILRDTLSSDDDDNDASSFFARNNQPSRLRAVFPSTTPAALTTLATATWPGRHGMPGWNLRDKKGCDLPGNQDTASPPVQLLVLSDHIRDARSGELASSMGFETWDEVFVEKPWARKHRTSEESGMGNDHHQQSRQQQQTTKRRRMIYVNAYNGDDYQNWSQGNNNNESKRKHSSSDATDFSSWFIGDDDTAHQKDGNKNSPHNNSQSTLFETAKIEETAYETLGEPEGSTDAIEYFRQGVDIALGSIATAEKAGDSTFIYLYTAHPDKHMHALGVEHEEVRKVVRGIEREVERFWRILCDREVLLSGEYEVINNECNDTEPALDSNKPGTVDAAVVVTADHGHITVHENDMVVLPKNIADLLEYANIGVHGKGRHGYLHCRAGLQKHLLQCWQANAELSENFLLLTVEEAIENGLFGPNCMRLEVRPRLGDFIAISLGRKTLVTPSELEKYQKCCQCQGAHGSLLPEEMSIPFILLCPNNK